MNLRDYEKLGAFYLGRITGSGTQDGDPLLYDAADLTTHAVIIGMTGSGKTGLGIGLIEEAALDRVPVIAIDPKGDLGNLLFTFPGLSAEEFLPWVDPAGAAAAGATPAAFAAAEARRWEDGLKEWDQDAARIARLRATVDLALYTPGSGARPLSVLASLGAPPAVVRADGDLYQDHVQAVATSLLTLAGVESDPVTGREHILVATVLDQAWQAGRPLDLAWLIGGIQAPGVARIGVMALDDFFPQKDRLALALRLNNLLAAPGFAAWTSGEPLSAARLLYTPAGQPRVSVLSIAHLDERERMFFVTLLLNELVAWMRTQPGTSALRAVLYMDEVAGYLPPVANPPAKNLFLTLFKQARAYGVGVVLATQNPVDLDYKALANAGTWFIGRLQTEQDRNRVRDNLLAASGTLDAGGLDALLAGLGKRRFLMHNVHDAAPVTFETRWTLSYLRGPLTRDDIRRLVAPPAPGPDVSARVAPDAAITPPPVVATSPGSATAPPVLPLDVPAAFVASTRPPAAGGKLVYRPALLGIGRIAYVQARTQVDVHADVALVLPADATAPDWRTAQPLGVMATDLRPAPEPMAEFAALPARPDEKAARDWARRFRRHLASERPLVLLRSPATRATSRPGETAGEFRARLQHLAREARDARVATLRAKYAPRVAKLEEALRRARQAVGREADEARTAQVAGAVSLGTTVLGALLGRRYVRRAGSTARQAGNAHKQTADVARARENVAALEARLAAMQAEVETALAGAALEDAGTDALEEVRIRPAAAGVEVSFCGIAWLPYVLQDTDARPVPAFGGLSAAT